MSHIGIIGLGVMGLQASKCLLKAGYRVFGYDPAKFAVARAKEAGVEICQSPAEVGSKVTTVLLVVPGPNECRQTIFGEQGLANQPTDNLLIANMSTVGPSSNIELSDRLAAQGVTLIDTPVLGLPSGVGHWAFPVGGSDEAFQRIVPVLRCLGGSDDRIFHVGDVGSGNKLKLLNNLMFGAITACTAEIMASAKDMGLSQKLLFEVPEAAGAGTISNLYKAMAGRIIEDNYEDPFFTIQLLKKDNALALDMAREHGISLTLAKTINAMNERGCDSGLGSSDISAMWKMLTDKN